MNITDNHINYIEFKANDLEKVKAFYSTVFNWTFIDYGEEYCSFDESGVSGGFELTKEDIVNGVLVVLYHQDLNHIKEKIIEAKGNITQDIFSFPGGKRFHFTDPSGNELAIWSDK